MASNTNNIEITLAARSANDSPQLPVADGGRRDGDASNAATAMGTSKKSKAIRICVLVAIALGALVVVSLSAGPVSNVSKRYVSAAAYGDDSECNEVSIKIRKSDSLRIAPSPAKGEVEAEEETTPSFNDDMTQMDLLDLSNENGPFRRELRGQGHVMRTKAMQKMKDESPKARNLKSDSKSSKSKVLSTAADMISRKSKCGKSSKTSKSSKTRGFIRLGPGYCLDKNGDQYNWAEEPAVNTVFTLSQCVDYCNSIATSYLRGMEHDGGEDGCACLFDLGKEPDDLKGGSFQTEYEGEVVDGSGPIKYYQYDSFFLDNKGGCFVRKD